MTTTQNETLLKSRNPFRALSSELIEDAALYQQLFSKSVIAGHAESVFQPNNVVVVGPQGSGKTMLLNLTRLEVLAEWKKKGERNWPEILDQVTPFFGISINLTKCHFHVFGRRSIADSLNRGENYGIEISAAADFIAQYLFYEFINAILLIRQDSSHGIRKWLGFSDAEVLKDSLLKNLVNDPVWGKYYTGADSWEGLLESVAKRLESWKNYLSFNTDSIPEEIWGTKVEPESAMNVLGRAVRKLAAEKDTALYVYIDQYEELVNLNKTHGSKLQRLINTLIKARDPYVFYKIGARSHDWGKEIRVLDSESIVEMQRDYILADLNEMFIRNEDKKGYVYKEFARDVGKRRLMFTEGIADNNKDLEAILGKWSPEKEERFYFRDKRKIRAVIMGVEKKIESIIINTYRKDATSFKYRLSSAWALQQRNQGKSLSEIESGIKGRNWENNDSWVKERKEPALIQIASMARARRRYFGLNRIIDLSGGNITIFLHICSEIWDFANRQGISFTDPKSPLDEILQSDAIWIASAKWRERERSEPRGYRRYNAINRIGPAMANYIKKDYALSNPGYSGFSIDESSMAIGENAKKAKEFLDDCVSRAVFEERRHKSKERKAGPRIKYFLQPILSPYYGLPIHRRKEPYYAKIDEVYEWVYGNGNVVFGKRNQKRKPVAMVTETIPFPNWE